MGLGQPWNPVYWGCLKWPNTSGEMYIRMGLTHMRSFNANQTALRCHFSSIKLAKVQKLDNACWWAFEQISTLIHHWWEFGNISRMTCCTLWPRILTSRIYSKAIITQIFKNLHTRLFTEVLFVIAKWILVPYNKCYAAIKAGRKISMNLYGVI